MHVERVRHAQLVPPAGAVRKPKYVESPRVPGEAALGAQRRPEPGEPSASGECVPGPAASPAWGGGPSVLGAGAAASARSSQLSPFCPALPGEEDPLCWEQALQALHGPHSCLLLRLAMVCCRHCCPRVLPCHTEQRPSGLFLNSSLIINCLQCVALHSLQCFVLEIL